MSNKPIFILLFLFLVTTVFASLMTFKINLPDNIWEGYEAEWKKVDSLENEGLPKSAAEVVNEIYAFAKKENNAPQLIKSITYRSKYLIELEEEGNVKAIQLFEEELKSASGPAKNILQSMLAELYWNYYSANRWKFQNRTQTVAFKNDDIATWDIATLHQKTLALYTASAENKAELKTISIKQYEDVLMPGDDYGRLMRPSLYDFLAHRAFDFLANDEAYISEPAYKFELDDPKIFGDNKSFVGYIFTSEDSLSKKLLALHLLQELTEIHLFDPMPSAIVDLDIKRFTFAKNNSILSNKDSLYLQALLSAEKRYGGDSSSARITFMIAQWHQQKASGYARLSGDDYKWELKTAVELCDKTIAKFPGSIGAKNCAALKETILYKDLQLEIEMVNSPDQPFRAAVTYRNMNEIALRIVKLSTEEITELAQMEYEARISVLRNKPVYREWKQTLPDDGDHNEHLTEIKIDALPIGTYVLFASVNPAFDTAKNRIVVKEVRISNIAYITNANNSGWNNNMAKEFYVVDRITGQPLKGANVQTFKREYDYETRKYKYNPLKTYTTDENGYFAVSDPLIKDYYYFSFSITYGKDFLDVNNNFYISKPYQQDKRNTYHTYLFTDRSIYRPGQTIYFKGIMTDEAYDGKTKQVVANRKTTVTLYDVNAQKVASLDLVTNDYGSFTGTFTAPQGLTGEMRIQNEFGTQYLSVEEYKRPTFSVSFDPVKGNYALGDSVHVTGMAASYAGASIDQAKVKYRVVRNASYPYFYDYGYWWRKIMPPSSTMEIINGETVTDAEGKFHIDFTAIPDLSLDKTLRPQFNYTVYADVTDISGETRSSQTYVSVGYVSLSITADVPATIYQESPATVKLYTSNLNGVSEPAAGKIKIYPLDAPDRLFRERTWAEPDKFIMTRAEYYKLFPQDAYDHETNAYSWPVMPAVADIGWNTATSDSIVVDAKNFMPGYYKLEMTTADKNGEEIKIERYFNVLNQSTFTPYPVYIFSDYTDTQKHPGESALIKFGSSAKNVKAIVEITHGDGTSSKQWISLPEENNKGKKGSMTDIEIAVTEKDRGGMNVTICFIKDGRFLTQSFFVQVPWDNKDLKVELETHRDKLQPGANETWKVKISGPKGEQVAAEMLASMYDASLDAFKGHYWASISWPSNYRYTYWDGGGFGNATGYEWTHNDWNRSTGYHYFDYDRINWFGLSIGYDTYYGDGYYDGIDRDFAPTKKYKLEAANGAVAEEEKSLDEVTIGGEGSKNKETFSFGTETLQDAAPDPFNDMPVRTNLNETAFFYPQLQTDESGSIIFSFVIPEALTKWNFKAFAHTKDLVSNQVFSSVVTQKELMIQPNMPRFIRESDEIEVTAKISNLTDSALSGTAQLELFNALTMQPVDIPFSNLTQRVNFTAKGKQSASVAWKLKIPDGFDAIVYRVKATAGGFTDGEENGLPVLTNRILVTESLPIWVRGNETKSFSFDKLIASANSTSIRSQSLTLEYTSNPSWYAVQALPYMMEYPYECAEQVFNRYYSNAIAMHIANSDPEIKRIFDAWKNNPESLTSNLEKNQELKSLLLEETPWVLQAQNETDRKKRVALLFDVNRMNNEMQSAISKLEKLQLPNGGWPWFKGYEDDRYITQYILAGMAHLKQLGVEDKTGRMNNILEKAIRYSDARMLEDYRLVQKDTANKSYQPSNLTIQYLYARSYFQGNSYSLPKENEEANTYYIGQLKTFLTKYSLYEKGLIALIMLREKETATAQSIIKSLKEYSLNSAEMGMYWKDNVAGYYWYQAPIETQALMIEVFGEAGDTKAVEDMKVWLLRQKQTTDWKTTKATAEACYALLLRGNSLLADKDLAVITVGRLVVQPETVEAGTGYFKTSWQGNAIQADFGKISVKPSADNEISWGAMYWQYFEDVDKITSSNTALQLTKKLFMQSNSATGPVLTPVSETSELHVGDLVKVRIELRVDRDMEYVHMKDMRASGFEPVNVLSEYKWQDGLGYYEATGDAATNFFISRLRKGTYVFEYPLRVTHKGNFSNGITTIQCMYAPEFTSHSEGIRVTVK